MPTRSARIRNQSLLAFAVAALSWTTACSSSKSPTDSTSRLTVTALTVSGAPTITVGETTQFTPTARMSDGTTQNVTNSATWQSTNPAVATVSSAGAVTAVNPGAVAITATYRGQSDTIAVTVVRGAGPGPVTVTAVTVAGVSPVTSGQTSQFTSTARLSDGTTQDVTSVAVWQSTNPAIATVSGVGVVTAVTPGAVSITATHKGQSGSIAVTVVPPVASGQVRLLYVIPQDREFRSDYSAAIQNALTDLQSWYRGQLAGKTFSLFSSQPEICRLPRPANYYASDSWSKVLNDVQSCAPVSYGSSVFAWVLYVDVIHACNAPGRLGAGTNGLTMLPRQDMDGLIGARYIDDCGVEYQLPITRYIGGAGHELGHAFGLSHPPGCDQGLPGCDKNALMWAGYSAYPNTYLRADEKQALLASPFIR